MTKPVVKIWLAALHPVETQDGVAQVLTGRVGDYPEDHGYGSSLSNQIVRTSKVVQVNEADNTVETMNTMYAVQSWAVEPDPLNT